MSTKNADGRMKYTSASENIKGCMKQLTEADSRHCSIFPGKYQPVPRSPVTDAVCMPTHRPPDARIVLDSTKRRPSEEMFLICKQPFDSSKRPENNICKLMGSNHKNHLPQKVSIMRNTITQPHTPAIARIALCRDCCNVSGFVSAILQVSFVRPGRIHPTVIAVEICKNQSNQGIQALWNSCANIPNKNAGPALLQNPSMRFAVSFGRYPLLNAFAVSCAPIG